MAPQKKSFCLDIQEAANSKIPNGGAFDVCPLPVEVIPNYMGINLCSVKSIEWNKTPDGQLIDLTIRFIPEDFAPVTRGK